ncbi:hypothetical protein SH668x_002574 [Planctomicrobium sp. SH668]|uniref:hypothetical protein n=1 Tax=Planctomicrobium sp. SH668 TaxID=3448126 RepID=UPI003F5BAE05
MASQSEQPLAEHDLSSLVQRCQILFSHAWMVRTFVKHSTEVEDFPELLSLPRTVFDVTRSLESRVDEPEAYFRQLKKKIRRLRLAANEFTVNAPLASTHLNFQQAAISYTACVDELERILLQVPPAAPAKRSGAGFRPVPSDSILKKAPEPNVSGSGTSNQSETLSAENSVPTVGDELSNLLDRLDDV